MDINRGEGSTGIRYSGFYKDERITHKGTHVGVICDSESHTDVMEDAYLWATLNAKKYKDNPVDAILEAGYRIFEEKL